MRWPLCLPLLILACSVRGPDRGNGAGAAAEPAYGRVGEFQGILTTGFEISAFDRCESKALATCRASACWFIQTEEFARQLKAAVPEQDGEGGNYFIRFRGRQADRGTFGHMDAYPCQTEGIALLSAEAGLP